MMGTSAIPRHPAQSNASSGPSDAVAGKARADAREKPVALRGGEAKAARMEGGGEWGGQEEEEEEEEEGVLAIDGTCSPRAPRAGGRGPRRASNN
ncbi:unnamed protein product [Prorocentrum cordatum]|uniref:Uncharacterized protein n=1 Tax=Prorocentrum cordatum TaxID=2364126 RepID=A0ABN9V5M8_9DINO|nr:unnamed protein product [Polarella glacialis]